MTQDNDQVARTWAVWCHLSALAWLPLILLGSIGILLPIPFLNIVGPLVVWLAKKEQHPFIDAHGKESLNFQISFTIYGVIAAIVFFFVIAVTCGVGLSNTNSSQLLSQIGLVLAVVGGVCSLIVGILQLVLIIFAAIKAKKGELYHYPFTLRFLR